MRLLVAASRCCFLQRTPSACVRYLSSAPGAANSVMTEAHTELFGITYARDDMTTVTPDLLERVGRCLHNNPAHPLNIIKRRIFDYFDRTYRKPQPSSAPLFTCIDNVNPVVTVEQNFDELLTPKNHPARRKEDSYYLNSSHMLRAHTSAHQSEFIRSGLDAFLVLGDVYRRDSVDRTHYPCFHQMEGVRLFSAAELLPDHVHPPSLFAENAAETPEMQLTHNAVAVKLLEEDLKTTLEGLVRHLFGSDIETEWSSEYFPFTHPSWELNVFFRGQWLEVLGSGLIRQEILCNAGASSKIGWAFGVGLERLAMILYDIPDIRIFWSSYHRFLDQFQEAAKDINKEVKFVPWSNHALIYMDISFWSREGKDFSEENDFMEICREEAGDLIEWMEKIDYYENPKAKPGDDKFSSYCYRLNYRHPFKNLSMAEVNEFQTKIRERVKKNLRVTLR